MRSIIILLAFAHLALAAEPLLFDEHIRPILSENCFSCHGADAQQRKADLRLDIAEGAFADLGGYAAVVAGEPGKSEIWLRIISNDEEEVMPPPRAHKKPLTSEQRALIKQWIEEGAPYQRRVAFEPGFAAWTLVARLLLNLNRGPHLN